MPSSRPPHCAYCKEGITPDKRLYSCAECGRHYHPGCYGRTLPGKPLGSPNWTCRRCLDKRIKRHGSPNYMRTTRLSDHDSKSTTSDGNTAKSSTSVGIEGRSTEMSSITSASFTPQTRDGVSPGSKCSVAGCPAKALAINGDMCSVHARDIDGQRNRAMATDGDSDASLQAARADGSAHKTTQAQLSINQALNSLLPQVSRKTGSSGGVIRPENFYSKSNGSSSTAQKRGQEARSPPDHSGVTGPARKKPRLDTDPALGYVGKPEAQFKKPWDTGFNPRRSTKPPEPPSQRPEKSSETGVTGKSRLPTNRTQRKFAPRIELSYKQSDATGNEQGSPSVSDSPQPSSSAPRATSRSTASPSRSGKEFVANDRLRAWYQLQRETVKYEQARDATLLDPNKNSYLRARSSFEISGSGGPSSSWMEERRVLEAGNKVSSSSFAETSPKPNTSHFFQPQFWSQSPRPPLSKQPSIPEEHLEGWKLLPKPQPPAATNVSDLDFDSLIYGQPGAAFPPPTVSVKKLQKPPPAPKPEPADEPFFMHMDPRLHWPQPQTEEWCQKKLREIEARGGRKANFGKAAQRMREQRLRNPPKTFERSLPDQIRNDPAWLSALERIREDELTELHQTQSSQRAGQRGHKAVKQGIKRQASTAGPSMPRKG